MPNNTPQAITLVHDVLKIFLLTYSVAPGKAFDKLLAIGNP